MHARVAELADALDLGSSVFRRVGSSPSARTIGFLPDSTRHRIHIRCFFISS